MIRELTSYICTYLWLQGSIAKINKKTHWICIDNDYENEPMWSYNDHGASALLAVGSVTDIPVNYH